MIDRFSGPWNASRFARFVYPSILMLGFVALYNSVDALFVSRYVGPEALAALNIIHPVVSLLLGFGLMLAVGGSAIVGMRLGARNKDDADAHFTQVLVANVVLAALLCAVLALTIDPVLNLLGAAGALRAPAQDYLAMMLWFGPSFTLAISFEYLARADGAPKVALAATLVGGLANIVLDYVFLALLGWGVRGAALATGIGNILSASVAAVYFCSGRSTLRFRKPRADWRFLISASFNGSSELVNALSAGFVTFLYNRMALALLGDTGVAAIGALMFFSWLVTAAQLGASTGYAPLLSYAWGAGDTRLFTFFLRASLASTGLLTLLALMAGLGLGPSIVLLFDAERGRLGDLLVQAVRIFSLQFLFSAFNIFSSGFFTALGDGKTSAIISVLRSLAGSIAGVIFLPALLGVQGLWLVGPFAESATFVFAGYAFLRFLGKRRRAENEEGKLRTACTS